MSTRKILTLASMAAMLFAPAAFGFVAAPPGQDRLGENVVEELVAGALRPVERRADRA